MSKLTTDGRRLIFLSLTILMMITIFSMSSETGEESAGISSKVAETVVKIIPGYSSMTVEKQESIFDCVHFIVRKGAHFTEYGILSLLLLGFFSTFNFKMYWKYIFSIGIAGIYAGTDEMHQLYITGRAGSLVDVCIDVAGATTFIVIAMLIIRLKSIKSIDKIINSNK